jgi:hypothetical protein
MLESTQNDMAISRAQEFEPQTEGSEVLLKGGMTAIAACLHLQ